MSHLLSPADTALIIKSLRWLVAAPSAKQKALVTSADLDGVNWMQVLKVAKEQRVLGFLAYALEQNKLFIHLEPNLRFFLTHGMLETQRQNKLKLNQFTEYQNFFEKEGITVIPLKGAALSYRLYQKIPFRPMGDTDLLVREQDLQKINALLALRGFVSKIDITKNRWHDKLRELNQIPFGKMPGGRQSLEIYGVDLDFHWKPTYRIGGNSIEMDIKTAWNNALPFKSTMGHSFFLSDADLFWHLLLHTAEFGGNSYLVQILDLALFMNQWTPKTLSEIQRRLSILPTSSQSALQTLLRDTASMFCEPPTNLCTPTLNNQELLSFFLDQKESNIYRRTRRAPIISKTPWSLKKRALYTVGYFLPNPEYYNIRLGKQGMSMYLEHWKALCKSLYCFLKKRKN